MTRCLLVTLTLIISTLITVPTATAAEERPILTASAAM